MPAPSLSPIERARIADAVKLAAVGTVRWRIAGRKCWYVANGKERLVTSAGTDRVFWALVGQVKREVERLREEKDEHERSSNSTESSSESVRAA